MNPKHVTSLELSKKLKEAGFPQNTEFYWINPFKRGNWKITDIHMWSLNGHHEYYAAPIASELGEWLPETIITHPKKHRPSKHWFLILHHFTKKCWGEDYWSVSYEHGDDEQGTHEYLGGEIDGIINSSTECDARAKMLLYLAENNLLDPKKL